MGINLFRFNDSVKVAKLFVADLVPKFNKAISIKINNLYQVIKLFVLTIRAKALVWLSQYWLYHYYIKYWLHIISIKYIRLFAVSVFLVLLFCCWFFYNDINSVIEPFFSGNERLNSLKTLLVSIGGALIGATAIAFSLIMFAMQVNVERMPHGLFRKFSSDSRLMLSFSITFLLAMAITTMSLVPDETKATFVIYSASLSVVLIFLFLIVAYRRALSLISPTKQLFFLLTDTRKTFQVWKKAAERTAPLLSHGKKNDDMPNQYSSHDLNRVAYFQQFPNWTAFAKTSISHCISYSRRYAEQGDHEVSEAALNALIAINVAYIDTKGKSFFINHPFFDNPLSRDGFITDTLEHLRQNVQIGVSRGDEQQIEQSFRALQQLCLLYLTVDYSTIDNSKSHANLAAAYLVGAVESLMSHDMTDVLMEGVSIMGNVAQAIVRQGDVNDVVNISEKIALVSCSGIVNQRHRPVIQVGIKELSKLTFSLLRNKSHGVKFTIEKVRGDVKLIAELMLKIPDTQFSSIHSSNLAAYYSGTSHDTLMSWLTQLVNSVIEADADNEDAKIVIQNISRWADKLYQTEKELLLLAIKEKSHFTFDVMHWVVHITKLLLALANTGACDQHYRDKLTNSAQWLISVLSWVPGDEESVRFVENYQLSELLFEAALDASNYENDDIALKIQNLLLGWAFKAGKYQTGWDTLEHACYGLACLNIIFDAGDNVLLDKITEKVNVDGAPSLEIRERTSSRIRDKADEYHAGHGMGSIEINMARVDQARLRTLLIEISKKLTPELSGEMEQQEGQED